MSAPTKGSRGDSLCAVGLDPGSMGPARVPPPDGRHASLASEGLNRCPSRCDSPRASNARSTMVPSMTKRKWLSAVLLVACAHQGPAGGPDLEKLRATPGALAPARDRRPGVPPDGRALGG